MIVQETEKVGVYKILKSIIKPDSVGKEIVHARVVNMLMDFSYSSKCD